MAWPFGWTANQQKVFQLAAWHGSVLEQKRDGSGLLFKRNRYLDPATGKFTQEDPVGLAGGLNAYGFARGDPVTYSDPFGLCPNPLARGLGSLQCAIEDIINAVKSGPSQLADFWRDPLKGGFTIRLATVALSAVDGPGEEGFIRLAGPAQGNISRILGEFLGQNVAGAEARLASRTLSPGVTREMLQEYAENTARPIVQGVQPASKSIPIRITAAAQAIQAARLRLIEAALEYWPK